MIIKYNIKTPKKIMIKEYLENLLPAALLTSINKQNIKFIVNDQLVYNYYLLDNGDVLQVIIPADIENENIIPINKEFKILYEDSYLLIIDKVPNLACIPTKKHFESSLANYVAAYYRKKGIASGIHFVNRLDYATSGIVVLAKNSYITTLMKDANLEKKYLLVTEKLVLEDGSIECGIEKDENSVIKRRVVNDYINSKTTFKVLKNVENHSLIEALLITGKTHQLRVHFSHFYSPILGDKIYGNSCDDNLKLHSYYFAFTHPVSKKRITITSYPDWYDDFC